MGTDKRERQKARRAARLEEAYRDYKRQRRRRRVVTGLVVVAVVVLAALGASFLFGDDEGDELSTTSTTVPTIPPSTAQPITRSDPGEAITGETPCPAADGSSPRTTSFETAPPVCIDPALSYTAEVTTSSGSFTIELDPVFAPIATNDFVVLSRYHYYDGLPFHRIIPGFVIQTGDATGEPIGSGSPGYTVEAELPTGLEGYQPGAVALSQSAEDGTAASQFFVYTGPAPVDGPRYPIFGRVTDGMDVVQQISSAGTATAGAALIGTPTETVTIESVTITEG